ncbi:hypothetical protein HanHA300_Chr07g0250651 [Helianthus annuus]|nr:hypothetical protein HanHA300_Chr07g0250651 [Helianthus annuus]KAJ0557721.1 hypothetical protein HanIR_Chr07g0328391 [Helianthus annuus]
MTRQQIVIHRSPMERRQLLLNPEPSSSSSSRSHRLAELAGGTTAECAAVVCCFPCTVVNILVLAVYKVPAGLCRKALKRKRRRRLLKNGLLVQNSGDVSDGNKSSHRISIDAAEFVELFKVKPVVDDEFVELENEMWEKFYGTGFWRSLSQRVN